jgi:hypothetical protein
MIAATGTNVRMPNQCSGVIDMSVAKAIMESVFQKRTGYKAMYNGKEISGCSECGNNHPFPGILPFAPTRKCIITSTSNETLLTIFDPYNIPEECPLRMTGELK